MLTEYDGNENQYFACAVKNETFNGKPIELWQIGDGWCWDSIDEAPAVFAINQQTQAYQDQWAVAQLESLWSRAFEEDATGSVYALLGENDWQKLGVEDLERARGSKLVVIDSGNSSGDAWKYTYYPHNKVSMFVYEASASA